MKGNRKVACKAGKVARLQCYLTLSEGGWVGCGCVLDDYIVLERFGMAAGEFSSPNWPSDEPVPSRNRLLSESLRSSPWLLGAAWGTCGLHVKVVMDFSMWQLGPWSVEFPITGCIYCSFLRLPHSHCIEHTEDDA